MSGEHIATCVIVICGQERKVDVTFEVESYGSGDSYFDPGEPPTIVINDVCDAETGRSLYDFCEQVRDIWAKPMYADGPFLLAHGMQWAGYPGARYRKPYAMIGFNAPYGAFHSLLDTLYEDVIDNHIPDNEPDYDYEPSVYYPDTRTEHDV